MLKRRPKPKPTRTFESLCILVLAGSGSMQELGSQHLSKGEKVGLAIHDMFVILKESRYAPCFDFAIVNYDHRSIIKMYPTPLKQINPDSDFNPSLGLGGGSFVSEGLRQAKSIAQNYLSQRCDGGLSRFVTILMMSDGMDSSPSRTMAICDELKQMENVMVYGVFVETMGADIRLLEERCKFMKNLCSYPDSYFTSVLDAEILTNFIIKSWS